MPSMFACLRRLNFFVFMCLVAASAVGSKADGQDAPGSVTAGPMAHPPPPKAQAPEQTAAPLATPQAPPAPVANYDKALFQKPIPPDQLSFLKQYDGAPSGDLYRDKQFHKLMKTFVPDCMFHYGWDKPLSDALDLELQGSRTPVQIRDGRYLLMSGAQDHMLGGRAFLWMDLQDGIGLGAFVFSPTNGEPTPAVNVFSRQIVHEDTLALSQMPPGFAEELIQWSTANRVPPVSARYFLTGSNKKILLEHDENYCLSWDGTVLPPESGCQQLAADAADMDLTEAYYLDETHHATNATAWMASDDEASFLVVRDGACRVGPDPLGCRIRMTKERTRTIVRSGPPPPRARH